MNRLPLNDVRLEPARFTEWPIPVSRGLFAAFLLQALLVAWRAWQKNPWLPAAQWPEGCLMLLGVATVLVSLARSLPAQNLVGVCAITGVISGAAHWLSATAAVPFGPYAYSRNAGQSLVDPLPASIPVLWILAVLAARGAAKSSLRRWRTAPQYGYWLLGLTLALIIWFDVTLEPFATVIKGYWIWAATKLPITWFGAPVVNFLGWLLTAGLIVAFATPFLLSKKPAPAAPEYLSGVVWCVLELSLANACAAHRLWLPCAIAAFGAVAVGGFSWWSWLATSSRRPSGIKVQPKDRPGISS